MAEPEAAHLRLHGGNIRLRRDPGMLPGLDGVLLRRQPEGIVAHGMQNVAALHPLVAGVDVCRDITQRVSDMQPYAGGVGEHIHDEFLRPGGVKALFSRVGRVEGFFPFPVILPLPFELLRHERVVAVRVFVAGFRLFCFAHTDFIRKIRSSGSATRSF